MAEKKSSWPWWGGLPVAGAAYWWFRLRSQSAPGMAAPAVKSIVLSLLVSVTPVGLSSVETVTVTVYNHGNGNALGVEGQVQQWVGDQLVTSQACYVGVVVAHSSGSCRVAFQRPAQGIAQYRTTLTDTSGHQASGAASGRLSVTTTTQNNVQDTRAQAQAGTAAAGTYACNPADDPPDDGSGEEPNPNDYVEKRFVWEYDGYEWEWDPLFPTEIKEIYAEFPRPLGGTNYATYATDPYEAPIMEQIVCMIQETAASEGYDAWETAEFTLAFVHSTLYVKDNVGTGYDEFPKYPIETLYDQAGDCEDTSILYASLLKGLGYGVVMLLFPGNAQVQGHMATGVLVDGSVPGGRYWNYNGGRYYYTETTGQYDWALGEFPSQMEGRSATVVPIVAKGQLGGLSWQAPTYDDGAWHYVLTLTNQGSATVHDVQVMMGYDAGNSRIWSKEVWNDGTDLGPFESVEVDFWLEPAPRNVNTRTMVWAWGSDAPTISAHSDYFQT